MGAKVTICNCRAMLFAPANFSSYDCEILDGVQSRAVRDLPCQNEPQADSLNTCAHSSHNQASEIEGMAESLTSLCSLCASFNVYNYLKQDGHRDVAIETVQRGGRILDCPLCASICNALEQDSALLPGPEKDYCIRFCVQSDDANPLRSGEVCQSARMLQVGLKRRFWKEEPGKDTMQPLCEFRIVAEKGKSTSPPLHHPSRRARC
jgi:hypothetical protein